MKWLPLTLALYFLVLALITCSDGNVIPEQGSNEQLVLVDDAHDGHDHPTSDFDGCSPLCTCHCCNVHLTIGELTEIISNIEYFTSSLSYLNNFQETDSFDFFVPPRV